MKGEEEHRWGEQSGEAGLRTQIVPAWPLLSVAFSYGISGPRVWGRGGQEHILCVNIYKMCVYVVMLLMIVSLYIFCD